MADNFWGKLGAPPSQVYAFGGGVLPLGSFGTSLIYRALGTHGGLCISLVVNMVPNHPRGGFFFPAARF